MRSLSLAFFVVALCSRMSFAHAQQAEAPDAPRVDVPLRGMVSAEGPRGAILEERPQGGADRGEAWRHVCDLPCRTEVTMNPHAEHRIVDGTRTMPVVIHGRDGKGVVVRYERASAARTPLIVGGVVVGLVGCVVGFAGVVSFLGNVNLDYHPDTVERRNHKARALLFVGGGLALVGVVTATLGTVIGPSSPTAVWHQDTRATRREPPTPTWARPELPTPPNHAAIVDLRF
jgi:hypothetical protein